MGKGSALKIAEYRKAVVELISISEKCPFGFLADGRMGYLCTYTGNDASEWLRGFREALARVKLHEKAIS